MTYEEEEEEEEMTTLLSLGVNYELNNQLK